MTTKTSACKIISQAMWKASLQSALLIPGLKKNRLDQEQYHQETAFSGNSSSKRYSERVEEPTKESEFSLSHNHGRRNHF